MKRILLYASRRAVSDAQPVRAAVLHSFSQLQYEVASFLADYPGFDCFIEIEGYPYVRGDSSRDAQ